MKNGKIRTKVAVLLFAMIFVVGTAFAATAGMLTFGGTVRINSVESTYARLEFDNVEMTWVFEDDWASVWASFNADIMRFGIDIYDTDRFANEVSLTDIPFSFQNTGNVPVRFTEMGWASHGPSIAIVLQDPNTGTYWNINSDLWSLEVLHPNQVVNGWIQLCSNFVQESLHFSDYSYDGWISFYYHLELHYEQA